MWRLPLACALVLSIGCGSACDDATALCKECDPSPEKCEQLFEDSSAEACEQVVESYEASCMR